MSVPLIVTLAVALSCHAEPIRCAQCKLREGSVSMGREMLPLRFAQVFGSPAQHDTDTRAWWFTRNTPYGMLASMLEASPVKDEKDAIRVN